MCHSAGLTVVSQRNYESGRRLPDAEYLRLVARKGVDVLFVVTGEKQVGETLPAVEADLVFHFRRAPPELRSAAVRVLGGAPGAAAAPVVHGAVGQVVQGDLHTPAQTFNVGGAKSVEKGGGQK